MTQSNQGKKKTKKNHLKPVQSTTANSAKSAMNWHFMKWH